MKKLIFLSLMMLFCLPLATYAASGGPPVQGLSIGINEENIFDRDLKPTVVVSPKAITTINCNIKNMYRTMLQVGYGFFDFFEVYVKLGGQAYQVKSFVEDQFGIPDGDVRVHGKYNFTYGGGLKAAYEFKDGPVRGLLIGADAQYLRSRQRYRANFTDSLGFEESSTGNATYQEWQVGPFVGYRVKNFLPYMGVKYSDVRINFSGGEAGATTKFKGEDVVGMFVGLTYNIIPHLMLNIEGEFFDYYGVNFNLIYKFK
jgi:hypothetical protein